MTVDEIVLHLKLDGWCVLDGVIPSDKVDAIRDSVEATASIPENPNAPSGVGFTGGLLAHDQSFAPYLADRRILDTAETFFGPHVRISFTSAIINNPGNERGGWHSDWPFNQKNAAHIPAPYPDAIIHLTTIWMLSSFSPETGGTLLVPGSHRPDNNPTGDNGIDRNSPYPTEMQATGNAGSVLLFDSRMWHATATNMSDKPRVGMAVRYAPWWLNLAPLMPHSDERARIVDETGISNPEVVPVPSSVFGSLPEDVKPLFRHWVRD